MLDSGQEVLSVLVSRGSQRLYAYKGRAMAFLRVGNSTKEMTCEEHNSLLFERLHAVQRWENEVAIGAPVNSAGSLRLIRSTDRERRALSLYWGQQKTVAEHVLQGMRTHQLAAAVPQEGI